MISKNQVGFEVFQFINPKAERPANNFECWKTSFSYLYNRTRYKTTHKENSRKWRKAENQSLGTNSR